MFFKHSLLIFFALVYPRLSAAEGKFAFGIILQFNIYSSYVCYCLKILEAILDLYCVNSTDCNPYQIPNKNTTAVCINNICVCTNDMTTLQVDCSVPTTVSFVLAFDVHSHSHTRVLFIAYSIGLSGKQSNWRKMSV